MQVSRMWYDLSVDQSLWRSLCHRPINYRLSSPEIENEHLRVNTREDGTIHWKNAFSERYRLFTIKMYFKKFDFLDCGEIGTQVVVLFALLSGMIKVYLVFN